MKIFSNAAKATIKSKLRLWIEYALIAAVVILLGYATWGWFQRAYLVQEIVQLEGDVREAETRIGLVEEVNRQQDAVINTLRGVSELNDTMLQGLAADMQSLYGRDQSIRTRLASLERNNEAVREYLDSAVPAPVVCVLDKTCPEDVAGDLPPAERRATDSVQPAKPAPKRDQPRPR